MKMENLKELVGLLQDTDITELLVEKEGVRVKLKREKLYAPVEISHSPVQEKRDMAVQIAEGQNEATEKGYLTVTSPIVGTFYRSAAPDAAPFVEVGTRVKKGEVICVIEAMKIMNEIECEFDGVVARHIVENGQPVEYGEPLFLLEPAVCL